MNTAAWPSKPAAGTAWQELQFATVPGLTGSADISDAAKAVLRAYGLLPVDGAKASDYDDDRLWFNNVADERLFGSGGGSGGAAHAGVGCSVGFWTNRGSVGVVIGWRSAYVDLESVGL